MTKNKPADKQKGLSENQRTELLNILKERFENNMNRHKNIIWENVEKKLEENLQKLWTLFQMEETGGEPDVINDGEDRGIYRFYDCSPESPKGRRSICYDRAALEARKKHKPANAVMDMACDIGIELLTEEQYKFLQEFGTFDQKTSSWIETPTNIRERGGALFCDYRYGHVFVYHNGASSYYNSRGFRGSLRI